MFYLNFTDDGTKTDPNTSTLWYRFLAVQYRLLDWSQSMIVQIAGSAGEVTKSAFHPFLRTGVFVRDQ